MNRYGCPEFKIGMLNHIKMIIFTGCGFLLGYIAAPNTQNLTEYYENNDFDLVKIIDGDTLHISRVEGEVIKVRLHGIDAPERGTAYFAASTQALSEVCTGQNIRLTHSQPDSFSRIAANVYCGDLHVNTALLTSGAAIVSIKHTDDPAFYAHQTQAQDNCRGVWGHDLDLNYPASRLTGHAKPLGQQRVNFKSRPDCLVKTAQRF